MMIEYIILVAVIAAGVMGIIITKNMFGSNEIHGKLKNRYLEYIDSLEKDNKKLTGKLNKMKQGVSISKDDFDEANPLFNRCFNFTIQHQCYQRNSTFTSKTHKP